MTIKAKKVRTDGRQFLEARESLLNCNSVSTADGSSLIKIGNTTAICGIKTVSIISTFHTNVEPIKIY